MEGKKRIYIDLDDVLCDTAGAYLHLVEREFGVRKRFEDIHSFNLQESFNLSDEENRLMFRYAHQPEFILNLALFEGVTEILGHWQDLGHHIAIVTGRHTSAYRDTLVWLEEHGVPYDTFTMVDKYNWDGTDHDRAVSLNELRGQSFDIGIEDNLKMTAFLAQEMNLPVLLHERPWNKNTGLLNKVTRFSSWKTLLEFQLPAEKLVN